MNRILKQFLLSILILGITMTPFYLPDNWVYVEKCESVYNSTWEIFAWISIMIFSYFAGVGIFKTVKDLNK